MAALHRGPSLALSLLLFGSVAALVANGRGIDEQLRTRQGHHTSAFGIPLVPANLHAKAAYARVDGLEAEVTGREVEFLVVGRVVGDVHLAVASGDFAVFFNHHGRVVVEAGAPFFEQACHQHHAQFPGQPAEALRAGPGDGFCQVEEVGVLGLAEVGGVVEFLQYHQLCAVGGQLADVVFQFLQIFADVVRTGLLYDSDFHLCMVLSFFLLLMCCAIAFLAVPGR